MRRRGKINVPEIREFWQIEQGKACGCGGSDDMCACQNMNPWPRPKLELQERLELAIRQCPGLDENGYITEKSEVLKAIRRVFEGQQ